MGIGVYNYSSELRIASESPLMVKLIIWLRPLRAQSTYFNKQIT
jgi:hypothetical protein